MSLPVTRKPAIPPYVREWRENSLLIFMLDRQKVRFRSGSQVPRWLAISPDAVGTVICRYRIPRDGEALPDRLDVRFGERLFAWGVPEKEFELIPNSSNH